jgi:sodium transport system permease protein
MSSARRPPGPLSQFLAVLRKESIDALRDRRTLQMIFFLCLIQGPLILFLISTLATERENRALKREVYVQGAAAAPGLRNYIERQAYRIRTPPADYEALLEANRLDDAVIVIGREFDARLQRGEAPVIEVLSNSNSRGSETARSAARSLIEGFAHERSVLSLALRGASADLLHPVDIEEHDMASAEGRSAQFTGAFIPLYVLLALIAGAMNAAMDTTAGERERGSLEPLMMNPASPWSIALGKWAAVAGLGLSVALLTSLSYLPAQALLRSEALQAIFQFGWIEALKFTLICVPFAGAVSALLMATSIRGKSVKEAQAGNSLVMALVLLLPLVSLMNDSAEPAWYLWVPSLAQQTLMMHVLKAEPFTSAHWLIPTLTCVIIAGLCLCYVSRSLRTNAVR